MKEWQAQHNSNKQLDGEHAPPLESGTHYLHVDKNFFSEILASLKATLRTVNRRCRLAVNFF